MKQQEWGFFDHLILFQKQYGGTIVVDGVPYAKRLAILDGPPEATFKSLAKTFDFSYQVENNNVILASRFEEPAHVPELTRDAFQAGLGELIKALKGLYRPPKEQSQLDQYAAVVKQLPPALRELAYGNQGLRLGQLPPELLDRFSAVYLADHYRNWIQEAAALEQTLRSLDTETVTAQAGGSIDVAGQTWMPPRATPLPPLDWRVDAATTPSLWTLRRYADALGRPLAPELIDHPAYFIGTVPSSDALRRLVRLNGWQVGTRVRRAAPGNPDSSTIGPALLRCLPASLARYLTARINEDGKDEHYPGLLPPSPSRFDEALKARHARKRDDSLRLLRQALAPGQPRRYATLPAAQQQAVVDLFVFEWLDRFATPLAWDALLPNGLLTQPQETVFRISPGHNEVTLENRNGGAVQISRGRRVQ